MALPPSRRLTTSPSPTRHRSCPAGPPANSIPSPGHRPVTWPTTRSRSSSTGPPVPTTAETCTSEPMFSRISAISGSPPPITPSFPTGSSRSPRTLPSSGSKSPPSPPPERRSISTTGTRPLPRSVTGMRRSCSSTISRERHWILQSGLLFPVTVSRLPTACTASRMPPGHQHTELSGRNPRSAPTSRSGPGSRHEPTGPMQGSGLPTIPAQGRPSGEFPKQVTNLQCIPEHLSAITGDPHALVHLHRPTGISLLTRLQASSPTSLPFLPAHLSSGAETMGRGRHPHGMTGSPPPSPLNSTISGTMDPWPATGSLSAPSCPTNQNMEARIILNSPLFFASLENA